MLPAYQSRIAREHQNCCAAIPALPELQKWVICRRSLGPDQARFFGLFLPHELTYSPLNRVLLWTVKPAAQEEEAWRRARCARRDVAGHEW